MAAVPTIRAAQPTKPHVPASLLHCLTDRDTDGGWDMPAQLPTRADLQATLASLENHMQPASKAHVAGVMAALQSMTRSAGTTEQDWRLRATEYHRLLGHYPADVWQDAYDTWLRTPDAGRFFPTVSELGKCLENIHGRRLIQIKRIREMLAEHERPKRAPIKPAERAERLRGMIATYERLGMTGKATEARKELAAAEREASRA